MDTRTAYFSKGSIRLVGAGDETVLCLEGDIDGSVVDSWRPEPAADGTLPVIKVVDAAGVTFLGSRGITFLIEQTAAYRAAGGRPVLRNASRITRRAVEVTGVDSLFDLRDD